MGYVQMTLAFGSNKCSQALFYSSFYSEISSD